jgi:hypothetical protein
MFNEILTGKASIEHTPPVAPPVQAPAPSRVSPAALANAEASARAFAESEAQRRRAQNSHRILAVAAAVVASLGFAMFRWGMRDAYEKDLRAGYGYSDESSSVTYDPFVSEARGFASQMCSCADKQCAWSVQATFDRWVRQTTPPTNTAVLDAAAAETERYQACLAKLAP